MQYLPQLLWGNVGAACDYSSIAVEEGGSGPASQIVSTVNIGSFVCVNPDGNEVLVDRTYDGRVRVRRLVHNVTPMAPRSCNVEQDWFPEDRALSKAVCPHLSHSILFKRPIQSVVDNDIITLDGVHCSCRNLWRPFSMIGVNPTSYGNCNLHSQTSLPIRH